MCELKKQYKLLIKRKKRIYNRNKYKSIENLRHKKPRDFWKLFCSKKSTQSDNISLNDFYTYFSQLANENTNCYETNAENFCKEKIDPDQNNFEELDRPITVREVEYAIKNLNRNKAAGIDCLMNEFFIESRDSICSHLADLFNVIFDTGYYPEDWAKGIIIPLYKKNNPDDVNNYRGITLISCLAKIFTGILNRRITLVCEQNELLSDAQFGFRSGRSTTDAIFVLSSIIQHYLNQNKRLYCAFIDMRKAFDSVYRNGLWFRLGNKGIKGKILRIFQDMYSKIKSCVKHNNIFSDFFDIPVGLLQGEVTSPILYSLFIEDIELFLQQDPSSGLNIQDITVILLLFADDMVLFGESPEDLQNSLNRLYVYCIKWGLSVNIDKTKVMVFRKRGPLKQKEKWFYNNIALENENVFKYLGTIFSYNGTFSSNMKTLADKGTKALNVLFANLKQFNFSPKTCCQLFDSFVGSILGYSGEVWGTTKSDVIERVHRNFCKRLLGVKSTTSSVAVYGELGRYPLYIFRHTRIIKYWLRIIDSENVIIKTLYNCLLNDLERGCNNWCTIVKNMLVNAGFGNVWNDQSSIINAEKFHLIFKQRLMDIYIQYWYESINRSHILSSYKFFKTDYVREKYLDILPKVYRTQISKLRLSSHPLRIETGRYGNNRVERSQRHCQICDMNVVEDEFHFLFICRRYTHLRKTYIKRTYYTRPNMQKCVYLLQSGSRKTLIDLAKYIKYALEIRNAAKNQ